MTVRIPETRADRCEFFAILLNERREFLVQMFETMSAKRDRLNFTERGNLLALVRELSDRNLGLSEEPEEQDDTEEQEPWKGGAN